MRVGDFCTQSYQPGLCDPHKSPKLFRDELYSCVRVRWVGPGPGALSRYGCWLGFSHMKWRREAVGQSGFGLLEPRVLCMLCRCSHTQLPDGCLLLISTSSKLHSPFQSPITPGSHGSPDKASEQALSSWSSSFILNLFIFKDLFICILCVCMYGYHPA